MALVYGSGHSDGPNTRQSEGNGKSNAIRRNANYVPDVWGDNFIASFSDNLKPDAQAQQRANELKEEVKRMLINASDSLQELNLIDAIQRLGVAYHFETEIANALLRMYNAFNDDGIDDGDHDLHAIALRFRLLRQEGYNVSPTVFNKFKDGEGNFKGTLVCDIRGLLSLYEAAYLGIHGENILDEAIAFTRHHLRSALPNLHSPLSALVELSLELPLRRCVERLQSRYYITIYQEEKERNDILLEFAKLDFNLLQLLHQKELKEILLWWQSWEFRKKLPFIRDRVVECYFWIVGVFFEPQYSRARLMMTRIISLTSIMDDIYDVHGILEELEPYTDAIQRWDRSAVDQMPDYMKLHFTALLDTVDKFEEELSREGKSYRISYLKEVYKKLSKGYLLEEQWHNKGYVPKYEEYMEVAVTTCGYPMLSLVSYVGMGDIATEEVFKWAITMPKIIEASALVCRLRDDITSNQLEQERGQVVSLIQINMHEQGSTYEETCEKVREMVEDAWKEINNECLKPTAFPLPLLMRPINLARIIELLYQHQDEYTSPTFESKERVSLVLVSPITM